MTNLLLIALVTMAIAPTPPQEAENSRSGGVPTYELSELKVHQFQPRHTDADELAGLAQGMFGRKYFVKERGQVGVRPVSNISTLGRRIVVYDVDEQVTRMVGLLEKLDIESAPAHPVRVENVLRTLEYSPRYVSLDALSSVLSSYRRVVLDEGNQVHNLSWSNDAGTIVLRDTEPRLKEMLALVSDVDVPEPQVMLTCYLIQGTMTHEEVDGVPGPLAEHMRKLVPGMGFEPAGFAMVRTSVGRGQGITMQLREEAPQSGTSGFELEMRPEAYDPKTGSLTVKSCGLTRTKAGARRLLFSTDTLMRGDEFTVLGASGSEPVFAVVRLSQLSK